MNMCHSHYANTLNDVSSASTQVRLFHLPGLIFYLPVPSTDLELYLQVVSDFLFTIFCCMSYIEVFSDSIPPLLIAINQHEIDPQTFNLLNQYGYVCMDARYMTLVKPLLSEQAT